MRLSVYLGRATYRTTGQTWQVLSSRPFSRSSRRSKATATESQSVQKYRTRNVGIIAHIDAGKTTTTERMLYYSGYTKRIGNVDEGSTVTDFLPAERARGITIQSAAITIHWTRNSWHSRLESQDQYTINLIDTPGHADFTFEVLRSLRVLDGAVCILDGVAGVEAQTEKVWYQAQTYGIPTIFYVNKMDRDGAKFGESVRQIASKLRVVPAVCQIPWYRDGEEGFQGVIDVVNLQGLQWKADSDGKDVKIISLEEIKAEQPQLVKEAYRARVHLIESLSEEDEVMVEHFLEHNEDHSAVPADEIWASIRRCLLVSKPRISPVFAGSSFRNIGVQPVLDAITALLPDPSETRDPPFMASGISGGLREFLSGKIQPPSKVSSKALSRARPTSLAKVSNLEACALAFKVVNDPKRGILVYIRIYHGTLTRNAVLYNTNLQTSERMPRLLRMYASDAIEESSLHAGEIGVIPNLKHARTGDTLLCYTGSNPKTGPPHPFNTLQLQPIEIPPPVFFTAVEPHTSADQSTVSSALSLLLREDPSLQLSENEETGQQLLNGMGELHLEIAANRLIQDFRAKASIGQIEIAYRECPSGAGEQVDFVYERNVAGLEGKAGCVAIVSAITAEEEVDAEGRVVDGNIVVVNGQRGVDGGEDDSDVKRALRNGALSALARGATFGYPVYGAKVEVTFDATKHSYGSKTTTSAISAAAREAVRTALRESAKNISPVLLEPVMRVIVNVDENTLGPVKRDIEANRNGIIESLEDLDTISGISNSATREDVHHIDLSKVYAPRDPFENAPATNSSTQQQITNRARVIIARVPLKEMIGYLKHLRSLTAGRGSFVMEVDGFRRMNKQRENLVLKELRGDF